MKFNEFNLSAELLAEIEKAGFVEASPIQEQTIPLALEGKDVIGQAQTGTGKTAAFGLPTLEKIDVDNTVIQALVIAPTRELAVQSQEELFRFGRSKGVKVRSVYGGSSIEKQIKALKSGAHIVVGTPGRLLDLIKRKALKLDHIETLILDEADEMLNMGFTDSINAILADVPQERNTLLFSATMSPEIARISKNYLHNAKEITIGRKNESTSNVKHVVYTVHAKDKYAALKRIVDYYPQIYGIIFCRTRKETQEIADKLIQDGYNADSLHGELSQAQRDYVMQKFRIKNIQLLVATDVAARGLDVDDLTHVINYGLPDEVESYTHRRGRTGRAGKTGIAISICHVREKGKIREIERIINKKFDKGKMPTGEQICEKQLFNLVDQIEKVKVNEEEIASLMPSIYRKLEWLDKEDIIKRVVSLEFNRMIDYYKDNDDIEVVDESAPRERGKRGGRGEAEEGYTRFFINFGKTDELTPPQLIELVNKCVPGKVRIGRIDLRDNFSFFEVEEGEANRVMDSMNGFEVDGRRISVEPAQAKGEGGKGSRGSRGGSRSGNGFRDRRDSGRKGRDSRRESDRGDRGGRRSGRGDDKPKRKFYEDAPRGKKKRSK